jgi:hypothetical protein
LTSLLRRLLSVPTLTPLQAHLAAGILALDTAHRAVLLLAGTVPLTRDAADYWSMGTAISAGDIFLFAEPTALRTPLYPWLLGASQALLGPYAMAAVLIVQHLLGLLATILAARLVVLLGGGGAGALMALGLGAVSFGRIQYDSFVLSESLFTVLTTLTAVTSVRWLQRSGDNRALVAGGVTGLAVLCRPTAQYLFVITAALKLVPWGTPERWVRRVREVSLYAAMLLLVVAPWLARNRIAFGEIFLTRGIGSRLWYAVFGPDGAVLELPPGEATSMVGHVEWRRYSGAVLELRRRGLPEVDRDAWMARQAVSAIRRQPRQYAAKVLRDAVRSFTSNVEAFPWFPRYRPDQPDGYARQVVLVAPGVVALFEPAFRFLYRYPPALLAGQALLGFIGLAAVARTREHRAGAVWCLVTLVYFAAVTAIVIYPLFRFRVPIVPILEAGQALALVRIAGVMRSREARRKGERSMVSFAPVEGPSLPAVR